MSPFRYLPDIAIADVAFEVSGRTLEEMFSSAVDAVLNVMVEKVDAIAPQTIVDITIDEAKLDRLLFSFLNEIIFFKDARDLLLRARSIRISNTGMGFHLEAKTAGDKLDPEKHRPGIDVKAVTLHLFEVRETSEGWTARVVVDV